MSGVPADVRAEVIGRDQSRCVACGDYVNTSSGRYSLQHRRARGMGGSRAADTNRPANLILMCGSATTDCHGAVEQAPTWASKMGYRVDQGVDPTTVPVFIIWLARKVLLTDDATYVELAA